MRDLGLPLIDIHGHIGTLQNPSPGLPPRWMWGDVHRIERMVISCGIDKLFISSLWSCAGQLAGENEVIEATKISEKLYFWTVLDPRSETNFEVAEKMLLNPRCTGIKLHPVWQGWDLRDHLGKVMSFAAERNAVVLCHTELGQEGANPFICAVEANKFPRAKLIMAHLGFGQPPRKSCSLDHVRAIQLNRHNNLYVDTASQAMIFAGLLEEVIKLIGSENVIFGTDLPLHFPQLILQRVLEAEISDSDKENILFRNARLLWPNIN
ncbi:MAG: amidohydrolase family protein [Firmicutes bacterium]|nr:amidohydrolase family protein [Bacillota bacterium]